MPLLPRTLALCSQPVLVRLLFGYKMNLHAHEWLAMGCTDCMISSAVVVAIMYSLAPN